MKFNVSQNPAQKAASTIAAQIDKYISEGEKVLWLLAGGSANAVYESMEDLLELNDYTNLTFILGDDRWAEDKNHPNANWPLFAYLPVFIKLEKLGANIKYILNSQSIKKDTQDFNDLIQNAVAQNYKIISLQGLGVDGHTAGITPANQADFTQAYDNNDWVVNHNLGGDFPNRITITFNTMAKADNVWLYAVGEKKKVILEKINELSRLNISELKNVLHQYPVMFLNQRSDLTIFTDQNINS